MTDDPGNEIRERFRATALPAAPVRLRERLAAVSTSPAATTTSRFGRARLVLALAAAIAVASIGVLIGGGADDPSPSPDDRVWGPLAVANMDGGNEARTEGVLRLTEECAFLAMPDGTRMLLVWPAARTTWNSDTRTISLRRLQTPESVTLGEGVPLALGGGGSSMSEDGLSGEAWATRFDWVAPPATECLTDERWVVSDALDPVAEATPEPPPYSFVCEEADPPAISCGEIVDTLVADIDRNLSSHTPIVAIEVTRSCETPCPPEPGPVEAKVSLSSPPGYVVTATFSRVDGELIWNMLIPGAETEPPDSPGLEPLLVCDPLAIDLEPALDCATAIDAARGALGSDHPPIAELRFVHSCWSTGIGSVGGCPPQMVGIVSIRFVGQLDVERFGISRVGGMWRAVEIPRSPPVAELNMTCTEVDPPALTCAAIRDAVLTALGPNHPPVSRIGVSTICAGGQIPMCDRYDMVDVGFAEPRPFEIHMFIRDGPGGQTLAFEDSEPVLQSFGPDYAASAPPGSGPWIWHAELSDDRRTLTIEFFGEEPPSAEDPCSVAYEPWVGRDGDALLVKLEVVPGQRAPVIPSPTPAPPGTVYACPSIGRPYVHHLALPEPFTGTIVRDLNGWALDLTP